MLPEPATAHKYAALSLDQMIGLFLAQLYGWLIRCHESGAPYVPHDIAENVAKADALVHAFIRSRAAARLECAGFIDAANAMRVPICSREPEANIERSQGCSTVCSREPEVRMELAQGCTPQTPAELLSRLETIIDQFERAETIASALARVILFVLTYISPEARRSNLWVHDFAALSILKLVSTGPAAFPWPPPFPPIPDSSLERALCEPQVRESIRRPVSTPPAHQVFWCQRRGSQIKSGIAGG